MNTVVDSYWNNTNDALNTLSSNFNIMDFVPFIIFVICCGFIIMFSYLFTNTVYHDIKKKMILLGGPANCRECETSEYIFVVRGPNKITDKNMLHVLYKREGNTPFAYLVLAEDINKAFEEISDKYDGNAPGIEL